MAMNFLFDVACRSAGAIVAASGAIPFAAGEGLPMAPTETAVTAFKKLRLEALAPSLVSSCCNLLHVGA
jgi:hypothetical protein